MWKYTYSRQNKQNGENLSTCTVHCHNIGRTFNLHPYRESDKPTVKHGKDIHAPFCTKICNETSLGLNTVCKDSCFHWNFKQHIWAFLLHNYMVLCKNGRNGKQKKSILKSYVRLFSYFCSQLLTLKGLVYDIRKIRIRTYG